MTGVTYQAFTTLHGKPIYVCTGCEGKAFATYRLGVIITHIERVHKDEA